MKRSKLLCLFILQKPGHSTDFVVHVTQFELEETFTKDLMLQNWKCYFFVIRMIHITFIPSETPHWNAKAANTNRIFIFPSTCFFTWKRFVKSIQTPFQSISSFLQLFCDFSAGKLTYMPIHARTVFSAETWKILKPVRHY